MEADEKQILTNIIQIRNSKRFSQNALAEALGISVATYSRIENGEVTLTYEKLAKIANFLEMRAIDVITYPEIYVSGNPTSTKVTVEFEVNRDEMIKLGLKDKILQVINK